MVCTGFCLKKTISAIPIAKKCGMNFFHFTLFLCCRSAFPVQYYGAKHVFSHRLQPRIHGRSGAVGHH
ncbi:hypothetical protein CF65_00424 [Aggregatibacter actinomycetemcomitans HK1651]|nr:hypothetical protein CF65_00424 [Aggregatibacter actinomycetemcomitans HK1651]